MTPELGALMDANGLTQLQISRFNVDAGRRGEVVDRSTRRAVLGVEGYFGNDWSYEVSANYGETKIDRLNLNNRINQRWHAGLDAVRDANGNIVCRVSVDPNAVNPHTGAAYLPIARDGCVPFSVFGNGAVSPEAAAWFNVAGVNESKLSQTVFSASVANSALFSLPAGVSLRRWPRAPYREEPGEHRPAGSAGADVPQRHPEPRWRVRRERSVRRNLDPAAG